MLLTGWCDLQKEFDDLIQADQPESLEHTVNLRGYESDGHKHDAYWDAWNTARVFCATRNKDAFLSTVEKMKQILSADAAQPLTLGSLFDFSSLSIGA